MRFALVGVLVVTGVACAGPDPLERAGIDPARLQVFQALPAAMPSSDNPMTPARVDLGRMLYYDTRLSLDGSVSCNTCHQLDAYGVDHRPTSAGIGRQVGGRNAPTVYHAAGQIVQFWDGRAATVEEQALGPILNPIEMGMPDAATTIERLRAVPEYVEAFRRAFPDAEPPISWENVGLAIGAFERGLVTPSRWDALLAGDRTALDPDELAGLKIFLDMGCQTCHNGPYVGGETMQRVGIVSPWPHQGDLGRYEVTGEEGDRYVFKVPTLRNIDRTGPYFHDGKVVPLDEAVALMARHQLGRELSDAEMDAVLRWLASLRGTIPAAYIQAPVLPPTAGP